MTSKQRRGLAIIGLIPLMATVGAGLGAAMIFKLSPQDKLEEHIRQKQRHLYLKRTGQLPRIPHA